MLRHLRSAHKMQGSTFQRCLMGPCGVDGVNQEVYFSSQSDLDQHRAKTHKIVDAITPESNPEQGRSLDNYDTVFELTDFI
jgi:hypothetical protein